MPICISAKHIVEQIRLHISKPKSMSQASLMSLWSDISLIWKENRRRGGDDFFFRSICHPIEQKIWMFLIRTFVYPPHKMSGLAWLENDNSNREAWRVRNGQKKVFQGRKWKDIITAKKEILTDRYKAYILFVKPSITAMQRCVVMTHKMLLSSCFWRFRLTNEAVVTYCVITFAHHVTCGLNR